MKGGRLYVNLPNNVDQSVAVGSYHKNSPVYSRTNPDCKVPRWSVPCRSQAHQTKEIASVFAPRLPVNEADGADERLALLRCQLQDLASFHPDGGHRLVLFLNVQLALEDDRVLRGGPHLLLHTLRPRIERTRAGARRQDVRRSTGS